MGTAHGFFSDRRPLEIPASGGQKGKYAEYQNISALIGILISRKLATLHELQTVYSLKDAYDLMEILIIDAYNNRQSNS